MCYSWIINLQPSRRHRLCDLIGSRQDKITDHYELKPHYYYLFGFLHKTILEFDPQTYNACTVFGEVLFRSLTWLKYISLGFWAYITILCRYSLQERCQGNFCRLQSVANISCLELGRISLFTFTTYGNQDASSLTIGILLEKSFDTAFNLP